jgi:hypothetical protein
MMDPGVKWTKKWLEGQHEGHMVPDRFRGVVTGEWVPARQLASGARVRELQQHLSLLGLLPAHCLDGIYGYRTRAAVRLLQLFVKGRTDLPDPGHPAGVAGPKVNAVLAALENQGPEAVWPKQEPRYYALALELLRSAQRGFAMDAQWQSCLASKAAADTLPPEQWSTSPEDVHLIGIRRPEQVGRTRWNEGCTDLFLLLANHRVWVLFGNTEPRPKNNNTTRLVRGQHRYRFGWHGIEKDTVQRCYLALRPWSKGVLVGKTPHYERIPSTVGTSALINLHWSGKGLSNWGKGCQVMAGQSFIDPAGHMVSCEEFAARKYQDLTDHGEKARTQGAFHLVPDLYLALGGALSVRGDGRALYYTLLDMKDLHRLAPTSLGLIHRAAKELGLKPD